MNTKKMNEHIDIDENKNGECQASFGFKRLADFLVSDTVPSLTGTLDELESIDGHLNDNKTVYPTFIGIGQTTSFTDIGRRQVGDKDHCGPVRRLNFRFGNWDNLICSVVMAMQNDPELAELLKDSVRCYLDVTATRGRTAAEAIDYLLRTWGKDEK